MVKKILSYLLVALMLVVTAVGAWEYEGELNPAVFTKWEIVDSHICKFGHLHETLINPDTTSDIEAIFAMFVKTPPQSDGNNSMLVQYEYYKNEVKYIFVLNGDTYIQTWPDKPVIPKSTPI